MYIESSLPRRPFQIARIISPLIEGSDAKMCIQFYYHMKGAGIGNLDLYFQSGISKEQKIYSIVGEQGNDWKVQTVELDPFPKQYQVFINRDLVRLKKKYGSTPRRLHQF